MYSLLYTHYYMLYLTLPLCYNMNFNCLIQYISIINSDDKGVIYNILHF